MWWGGVKVCRGCASGDILLPVTFLGLAFQNWPDKYPVETWSSWHGGWQFPWTKYSPSSPRGRIIFLPPNYCTPIWLVRYWTNKNLMIIIIIIFANTITIIRLQFRPPFIACTHKQCQSAVCIMYQSWNINNNIFYTRDLFLYNYNNYYTKNKIFTSS